jgi:hypothetical protein
MDCVIFGDWVDLKTLPFELVMIAEVKFWKKQGEQIKWNRG